jgi:hypothetical protein
VPSATFSLIQESVRSKVTGHVCSVRGIDASSIILLYTGGTLDPAHGIRIPLHAMTSALRACATAFISDSAVDVDTLPWPVFCGTHSEFNVE